MSEDKKGLIDRAEQVLLHTYNRYQIVLDHGEGVYLYDSEGNVIGQFGVGNPVAEGELCSLPTAPTTECGLEGCNETRLHQHQGERCILVDPVCTVTGCTAEGYHTHHGVGYCDGAAQHSQNRHRNGHH